VSDRVDGRKWLKPNALPEATDATRAVDVSMRSRIS
jgi:hypothetical protein